MTDAPRAATAAPARPPWWRLRLRVLWISLAAVVVVVLGAGWFMLSMPGRTFRGAAPPLDDAGRALRAELEADVRRLGGEIGERSVYRTAQMDAAAAYVESELTAAGLAPTREVFAAVGAPRANVVAEVPGSGPRASEIVVVGAHYDSVMGSPGANDNGTGVAVLIALARRLAGSRPERTLRFVAFACEEPPCFQTERMGSLVHARAALARGERIVAMIALETLGCWRDEEGSQEYPIRGLGLVLPTTGNFLAFVGDLSSRSLVREAIGTFREHATVPSEGAALPGAVPGIGWSDHWAFWQTGVPAVMVTDTAVFRDRAYHREFDLPERVDHERLARVTQGLLPVVARLASPR